SIDCCHSLRWAGFQWPRMWATKVATSSRNVMALAGTVAPAKAARGSTPRSLASLSSARLARASGGVLANREFTLAAFEHVAEGPAPAAPFDLELQPLAIAVLAALQAGDGFSRKRALEHRI